MNAQTKIDVGPALTELYPPFALWHSLYSRLLRAGKTEEAAKALETAQMIAAAFRAGMEHGSRTR